MRRGSLVVLSLAIVFSTNQRAQAFPIVRHHHGYPVAPAGMAPAAPFSLGQVVQGVQLFQLLLQDLGQTGAGNRTGTGTATLPPVPQDVVATINRVDTALPKLVDKINALSELNPKYKDKISVSKSSVDPGTSGPPK